jgi:ribosome biogenesis GTPase A
LLLIERIKQAYMQFQVLVKKPEELEDAEDFFEDQFQKVRKIAEKRIKRLHKFVVVGITKAGKSTMLNKLIGKNVLITNEKRATAIRWAVNFHNHDKFHL